jgi:uncharacterized membrane protein YjjP (DUF1212 family)
VQARLTRVAHAYSARTALISAFPTFLMVTMGSGEPATLELTSVTTGPRLDQIAALDHLVREAEAGRVSPATGLRRLDEISEMRPRFGRLPRLAGYAVLTAGICLILQPAPPEVVAAAVLGALVGWMRSVAGHQAPVQALMPLIAAFSVSALSALAVDHDLTDPGLRPMVAALVVFLPGTTLATAVLELAAGQMVSGSSRLVSGAMQLALLTFGIIAGIQAVGVSTRLVFSGSSDVLGDWAPWLGVLVFAAGVLVANSAPPRSFPGLLLVLYAAWAGQVAGNAIFGGYVSAFVGALVMTPVAAWVSRLPSPSASCAARSCRAGWRPRAATSSSSGPAVRGADRGATLPPGGAGRAGRPGATRRWWRNAHRRGPARRIAAAALGGSRPGGGGQHVAGEATHLPGAAGQLHQYVVDPGRA